VTSSVAPSAFGQAVTFTAPLSPDPSVTAAPTGTIAFYDGTTWLANVSLTGDTATWSDSYLAPGTHPITAVYSGDANFDPATSPVLSEVVNTDPTTTTVSAAPASVQSNQTATLTATVVAGGNQCGANPTGYLTFYDGTTDLGTVAGSSTYVGFCTYELTAALHLTDPSVGTHAITAVYGGDANFASSQGTTSVVSTATSTGGTTGTTPVTVALTSSSATPTFGQSVTFTATLTPQGTTAPTGTIAFYDGTTRLGTGTLTGDVATFTTTALAVATHSITAVYSGDATYAPATTSYTLTVGASSGNCWMDVTSASGTTVLAQSLTAGTTHPLTLSGKATILIGAPTVAVLKIDNVPAVLPAGAGAPFTVTIIPGG
jgi:hypothetical protein